MLYKHITKQTHRREDFNQKSANVWGGPIASEHKPARTYFYNNPPTSCYFHHKTHPTENRLAQILCTNFDIPSQQICLLQIFGISFIRKEETQQYNALCILKEGGWERTAKHELCGKTFTLQAIQRACIQPPFKPPPCSSVRSKYNNFVCLFSSPIYLNRSYVGYIQYMEYLSTCVISQSLRFVCVLKVECR